MKKLKKKIIPKFKSEAQERAFWSAHDSSEYLDWTKAQRVVLAALMGEENRLVRIDV
jgi:hypothetical protein